MTRLSWPTWGEVGGGGRTRCSSPEVKGAKRAGNQNAWEERPRDLGWRVQNRGHGMIASRAWQQVITEGCWESLAARSALIGQISTSIIDPGLKPNHIIICLTLDVTLACGDWTLSIFRANLVSFPQMNPFPSCRGSAESQGEC